MFQKMTLLLGQIVVAISFSSLVYCGSLKQNAVIISALDTPKERMVSDNVDSCPEINPKYPVLLPHPDDCTKFYICDNGVRHLKQCQFGLHFNPKIQACDFSKRAGCDAGVTQKPKGRMVYDDLDLCPVDSLETVLLPHPTDCSKYYACDNGDHVLKKCPSGLHFNPKIQACDYPENAGCDSGVTRKPKGRMIDDSDSCPAENSEIPVFLPHPEDCSRFYLCDNGYRLLKKCPSGLHFNPKVQACDFPKNAGCNSDDLVEPKGKDTDYNVCPTENSDHPVFLTDPEDCNKFYICDNGNSFQQKCPSGLHFSPNIKACDYPENAGCNSEMSVSRAGVPSPYCPSVNGKIPIFFRDPHNCTVYYMCSHGLAYKFVCPARLHFNIRKRVCDYEWKADCRIANS